MRQLYSCLRMISVQRQTFAIDERLYSIWEQEAMYPNSHNCFVIAKTHDQANRLP